jgi:hypothetical protein
VIPAAVTTHGPNPGEHAPAGLVALNISPEESEGEFEENCVNVVPVVAD